MDQIRLRPSNPQACLERAKMHWGQMAMWPTVDLGHEEASGDTSNAWWFRSTAFGNHLKGEFWKLFL